MHTFNFLASSHHAPQGWGKMGTLLGHDGQMQVQVITYDGNPGHDGLGQ